MKLTLVFLIMALMQVSAKTYSQQINLNEKNTHLEKVLHSIEKQTGYVFLYTNKGIKEAIVTVHVTNSSIDETLKACFENSAITFKIVNKNILLKLNEPSSPDGTSGSSVLAIKIHGTVTDSKDQLPLPGVTIQLVGGAQRAMTNEKGEFTINVPEKSQLKITMLGYKPLIVAASANMKISLDVDVKSLDDVVILGYGTQKKDLVTGSVSTLKMDDARRNSPTTTLGNLLAGQMPGVRVNTPAGRAGTAPTIKIREKSSFNDQNVLYVIDGLVTDNANDFNNLSPNDIDNITALKDAAATAAYGARASGGVIVVTTRRGEKNQKAKINYSFNTGFDKRGKNADLTSAIETGQIYNRINPTAPDRWTESDFNYFKNINNGYGYNIIDYIWQNPSITTHNLSASGGSDKLSYFVGGSYVKQNAFQKNTSFDNYNFRVNLTADVTKNLTLFTGLSLNNNVTHRPPGNNETDDYRAELLRQPYQPVWTDAGNPIIFDWHNLGAEMRGDGGYSKENVLNPTINLKATYRVPLIDGLSASGQYIKTFSDDHIKRYFKRYNLWVMKTFDTPKQISTKESDVISIRPSGHNSEYLEEDYNWTHNAQLNFQLNYDHTFSGVHHVQGWLAYEKAEYKSGGFKAGRENFPVYYTDQWWATSDQRADSYVDGSTEQTIGRKSYVGQFFYDYSSKYLASFTYRYDGSYKFAPDERWGFFPSGSLGWVISRENFFSGVKGIEMLKLRASMGTTSADNVDGWQYQQKYKNGNSAYFGSTPTSNVGIGYDKLVNPDITWEKSRNYNLAVDVNFLKHFNATVEYFKVKTYDILVARVAQVPPTFSRSLPTSNYGEFKTEGVELSLGYRNKVNKVNYYVNMNASYSAGTPLIRDKNITYPWEIDVNRSASKQIAYVSTGMIRTKADLDAFVAANPTYTFQGFKPALGQLTYADLSGPNGKPDGIVDNWDKTIIKNNANPVSLGLNLGVEWKGFSLDASFAGLVHNYRFVNDLVDGNVEWNRMWKPWAYDAWTPENPNASLPIRYSANDNTRAVTNTQSTFWFKNADFLRMRMLSAGYSIPSKITNKMGINGLKFYFSGSNLFIISGFNKKYFDPENGPFGYPIMKSFNFGINVSL